MPRLCSICSHPQRQAIDLALVEHQAGYRRIASRFGVVETSLRRHEAKHLQTSLRQRKELQAMLSADNLLAKLGALDTATLEMLMEARTAGDLRTALTAVRESRSNIEAFSRIGILSDVEQRLTRLEQEQSDDDHDDAAQD